MGRKRLPGGLTSPAATALHWVYSWR